MENDIASRNVGIYPSENAGVCVDSGEKNAGFFAGMKCNCFLLAEVLKFMLTKIQLLYCLWFSRDFNWKDVSVGCLNHWSDC